MRNPAIQLSVGLSCLLSAHPSWRGSPSSSPPSPLPSSPASRVARRPQGDDYIMYCHPNKQKIPRSDRLRAWYLDMLRRSKEEGIVTHISTLWDTFFEGGRDHRCDRISATYIPYLEGDYWHGEAEHWLKDMQEGTLKVRPTRGYRQTMLQCQRFLVSWGRQLVAATTGVLCMHARYAATRPTSAQLVHFDRIGSKRDCLPPRGL